MRQVVWRGPPDAGFFMLLSVPGFGLAKAIPVGLSALIAMTGAAVSASAQSAVFASVIELDLPVGPGAQEPSLATLADGRVAMSWTEPAGRGFAVRTAIGDRAGWSEPRKVVQSDDLFVNWADFPIVATFADGTLAISWLVENAKSSYAYDVNIALSGDEGATWGEVIVPHEDRSKRQHGFVSLLPVEDRVLAVWLDARAYDTEATGAAYDAFGNAMQLRATTIGVDGSLSEDVALDVRTCTCCQTSAAVTGSGDVLVVYRDRTEGEIRDISIVRLSGGEWSEPEVVHADGWEISGCPVNGPAIDAGGDRAVVAWFTEANDVPAVNVVFSDDAGASFGPAVRVDGGQGVGRVDVLLLDDGTALVSWVEWVGQAEALTVCRAVFGGGCGARQVIAVNRVAGSMNFPRMVQGADGVYIAWTQPLPPGAGNPDLDLTVRMVLATF